MMKPNDFKLNTDYLTIAQLSSFPSYAITYPSRTFPTDGRHLLDFNIDYDIIYPSAKGAVDRFNIEYNGVKTYSSTLYGQPNIIQLPEGSYGPDQSWLLTVFRKDDKTIVARCVFMPPSSASGVPSTPALTFKISASSFAPPNVF